MNSSSIEAKSRASSEVGNNANGANGAFANASGNIIIFDTTLRDGEQSPGATMTLSEKKKIASQLDDMGVDIIEAGFPNASPGDFKAVQAIAQLARNARICGLARAEESDIRAAGEAVKPARAARIHTFISTSPLHMKYKLQLSPDQVYERVVASVKLARSLCEDVEWSPEDGTRSEVDFLCRCIEAAITAGATTINIPDTVGYAVPQEYGDLIKTLRERVPNSDKAVFSVHCHNDLGLAVANSLAGVRGGARQIECTINGLGERAGNAALEEVVMALNTRADAFNLSNSIETTRLLAVSRLVSSCTGFLVQHNKAIVGKNAFAHEAGIHQDGMLKHSATYEVMTPASIGWSESSLVLGKHSGRAALRDKLEKLGYDIDDEELRAVFRDFKVLADKKKDIYDEDIIALMDGARASGADGAKLVDLRVVAGTAGPQQAEVSIELAGEMHHATASGNGPVDAVFGAIKQIIPHRAELGLFQVSAVTQGTDAQGEVIVRLKSEDKLVTGHGADVDILVASAIAYISAADRLSKLTERLPASL